MFCGRRVVRGIWRTIRHNGTSRGQRLQLAVHEKPQIASIGFRSHHVLLQSARALAKGWGRVAFGLAAAGTVLFELRTQIAYCDAKKAEEIVNLCCAGQVKPSITSPCYVPLQHSLLSLSNIHKLSVSSPLSLLSSHSQKKAQHLSLTRRHANLKRGGAEEERMEKQQMEAAAKADPQRILIECGVPPGIAGRVCGNSAFAAPLAPLRLLPFVQSEMAKTHLLKSSLLLINDIPEIRRGGVDFIVAVFCCLLAQAAIPNLSSHLQFIEDQLAVLGGQREVEASEAGLVVANAIFSYGALREVCA